MNVVNYMGISGDSIVKVDEIINCSENYVFATASPNADFSYQQYNKFKAVVVNEKMFFEDVELKKFMKRIKSTTLMIVDDRKFTFNYSREEFKRIAGAIFISDIISGIIDLVEPNHLTHFFVRKYFNEISKYDLHDSNYITTITNMLDSSFESVIGDGCVLNNFEGVLNSIDIIKDTLEYKKKFGSNKLNMPVLYSIGLEQEVLKNYDILVVDRLLSITKKDSINIELLNLIVKHNLVTYKIYEEVVGDTDSVLSGDWFKQLVNRSCGE